MEGTTIGIINLAINDQSSTALTKISQGFNQVSYSAIQTQVQWDKVYQSAQRIGGSIRNLTVGYLFTIFAQERMVESTAAVGQSLLSLNETVLQATYMAQNLGASNLDLAMSSSQFQMAQQQVEALLPVYEKLKAAQLSATGNLGTYNIATAQLDVFEAMHPGFEQSRQAVEQAKLMKDQLLSQQLQLAVSRLALVENMRIAQISEQILEVMTVMSAAQIGFELAGPIGAAVGLGIGGLAALGEAAQFSQFQDSFASVINQLNDSASATGDNTSAITNLTDSINKLTDQLSGKSGVSTGPTNPSNNGLTSQVWANGQAPWTQQAGSA